MESGALDMPIWKISQKKPIKVRNTTLETEKLLEDRLEDWIVEDSSILGEPLLLIGRQVSIPEVNDRLDLLALDVQGNTVVVELKRGPLKDPVDMQALRFASYISNWRFDDFERQAKAFIGKSGETEFNFNETYEKFCASEGIDETPDLNTDQRLIIMGSEIKERLGSVALWLRDHNVDIKVIETELYQDGETTYLQPQVIIPLPVSRFAETGRISEAVSKPWKTDGRSWHLEKRCSPMTREMLLKVDEIISDSLEVEGPQWGQKDYISYKIGNSIWLWLNTHPKMLVLNFNVRAKAFTEQDIAGALAIVPYSQAQSQAEKMSLGSSIAIEEIDDSHDYAHLRVKENFDLTSKSFLEFLKETYSAFPRQQT
jgi:hypothetical protein